ncbi:MAG TPA: hypothetical protein VD969_26820 [Symbiobacteriaceae bacterium]|nr:hypothetical protein [Symbiobacteriaceae bacterium]
MLYIVLALSGLLPAAWIIWRRRDATLVVTYVVAAAFVHTADWLASGALGLYKYHPGLFSDPTLDDATGVLLSELVFVASLAVLLVSLIPSWWGVLVGSAIATALEYPFVAVGGLERKGWTIWLTTGSFAVYYGLIWFGWRMAARRQGPAGGWPPFTMRTALAIMFNGMAEIVLWATQAVTWSIAIVPSQGENQALLRFLWHAAIHVPLTYWILAARRPMQRLRLLLATLASVLAGQLSVMAGLRTFKAPWNPVTEGLLISGFFTLAVLTEHWIRAWSVARTEGA